MNTNRPHVRVDPAQRFGRPNVKGISCEAIGEQLLAVDDIDILTDEYDLNRGDVLVACWYLGMYGSPAWRKRWKAWAEEAHQQMWHAGTVDYDTVPGPPGEVGR
jgi:uncharacterized protein (DUF433 family)